MTNNWYVQELKEKEEKEKARLREKEEKEEAKRREKEVKEKKKWEKKEAKLKEEQQKKEQRKREKELKEEAKLEKEKEKEIEKKQRVAVSMCFCVPALIFSFTHCSLHTARRHSKYKITSAAAITNTHRMFGTPLEKVMCPTGDSLQPQMPLVVMKGINFLQGNDFYLCSLNDRYILFCRPSQVGRHL